MAKLHERFMSPDDLKRLGSMLAHADGKQVTIAPRPLLLTGVRSSKTTGLRWNRIFGAHVVLPDRKVDRRQISFHCPHESPPHWEIWIRRRDGASVLRVIRVPALRKALSAFL